MGSAPKTQSTPPPANPPISADYSQTGPESTSPASGRAYAGTLLTKPGRDLTSETRTTGSQLLGGG